MNVTFSSEELDFASEVRALLRNEFPQDILEKQRQAIPLDREDIVRWHKRPIRKGWAAPNWPTSTAAQAGPRCRNTFLLTSKRVRPRLYLSFGVSMVGPIIYTFGTERTETALSARHPAIQHLVVPGLLGARRRLRPCVAKTRADLDGDHYVVNGTKTWTTLGNMPTGFSAWCEQTRTSHDARKASASFWST